MGVHSVSYDNNYFTRLEGIMNTAHILRKGCLIFLGLFSPQRYGLMVVQPVLTQTNVSLNSNQAIGSITPLINQKISLPKIFAAISLTQIP